MKMIGTCARWFPMSLSLIHICYAALGPFGVADFGGLDTFDHINTYLNAELDDSKVGNKRLHEMVEAGKLGVKSGQGFYDYSGDKADERCV